jgi:hypothetical protein
MPQVAMLQPGQLFSAEPQPSPPQAATQCALQEKKTKNRKPLFKRLAILFS